MRTPSESIKTHLNQLKINVYDSEALLSNEEKSFYANNKNSFQTIDEITVEKMNLQEIKTVLIHHIKRMKDLENELKSKNEKILKLEIELADSKRNKGIPAYDYSNFTNSPVHSIFKDNMTSYKQSTILNNSVNNRSIDSNGNSSNSYINNMKMNHYSNSFSTLSLNIQTKAVNRTDIVSYNLKRPELDIEELYDKEMESYLSHAKKEELTDDTFTGYIMGTKDNNKESVTLKEANTQKNTTQEKLSTTTITHATNKPNIRSVSVISKLTKNMTPARQPKETPKKVGTSKPETASNLKKNGLAAAIGQNIVAAVKKSTQSGNTASSSNNHATNANIKSIKRENVLSVEKNKPSINSTDYSTKSKNNGNSGLLSTINKAANLKISTQNLNTEKLDLKNISFNTKESVRTNSVIRTAANQINEKNFGTKAEIPRNKNASVTRKK